MSLQTSNLFPTVMRSGYTPLDKQSKWPHNGSLDPKILRDLYNFCERMGKWKEIPYIQAFSYLQTKLSLCLPCNPKHLLLALKSTPLSFLHVPKYPQLPKNPLDNAPHWALLSPPGSRQELCPLTVSLHLNLCVCVSKYVNEKYFSTSRWY